MDELSDQILLRAWVRGDRAAFDAIFRRYAGRVHGTAYRLTGNWDDAEDSLQEVFITLARKAGTIRSGGGLGAWIYRTACNAAMDRLRARRRTIPMDEADPKTGGVIAVESLRRETEREEARERDEMLRWIEAMIPRLPERQAAVFVLRYFQGLSHREIGAVLDCTEGASKSHHSLACAKLREWVRQETEQEERAERERARARKDAGGGGR